VGAPLSFVASATVTDGDGGSDTVASSRSSADSNDNSGCCGPSFAFAFAAASASAVAAFHFWCSLFNVPADSAPFNFVRASFWLSPFSKWLVTFLSIAGVTFQAPRLT